MSGFSFRGSRLERDLRRARPAPSDELEASIVARLEAGRPRRVSFRLAFAGALTVAVTAALASVGGLSYAANAAQEAVQVVKRVVSPDGAVAVSGLTGGSDQYRPGFGWGDPNHNHTGPPGLQRRGGELAPPLRAKQPKSKKASATVSTSITVDEQGWIYFSVVDPATGKKLLLTQNKSAIGQRVAGRQVKTIKYQVLIPREINLRLAIPANLLVKGKRYVIVVKAVDPEGNARTIRIAFIG